MLHASSEKYLQIKKLKRKKKKNYNILAYFNVNSVSFQIGLMLPVLENFPKDYVFVSRFKIFNILKNLMLFILKNNIYICGFIFSFLNKKMCL